MVYIPTRTKQVATTWYCTAVSNEIALHENANRFHIIWLLLHGHYMHSRVTADTQRLHPEQGQMMMDIKQGRLILFGQILEIKSLQKKGNYAAQQIREGAAEDCNLLPLPTCRGQSLNIFITQHVYFKDPSSTCRDLDLKQSTTWPNIQNNQFSAENCGFSLILRIIHKVHIRYVIIERKPFFQEFREHFIKVNLS